MENPVIFARRFANLVWLLMHEPANVDEAKGVLRALVAQAKDGEFHLGVHPAGLSANDQPVPDAFTGVGDLVQRLTAHGLVLVSSDLNASAADLLAVARLLAGPAIPDDHGAGVEQQRVDAGVRTMRFATRPRVPPQAPAEAPRGTTSMSIPEIDFGEIYDDPFGEAMARATPRNTLAMLTPSKSHDAGGLFAQFAASQGPSETYTELLAQLKSSSDMSIIDRVLDDLVILADRAATEGRPAEVTDILCGVTKREQSAEHEIKRAVGMSIRRLAKPSLLRAVAVQMAHAPEQRSDCVAVFSRAGEEGADALIELISDPAQQRNRRLYFDVLVELKAGVPALLHMLTDTRWFAIRNAAELLGEMQVREAEQPLSDLLLHTDERARRAAKGALMRLGTQRAMQTILEALASPEEEVRIEAAAALATRRDSQAVPTLLNALETERDEDVQSMLMLALGKHGTPEAMSRLRDAAAPERSLFKRKSTAYRVAAVHGLAEAKTAESLEALRALQSDKDSEVASAATFGLRRISRGDSKVTTEP